MSEIFVLEHLELVVSILNDVDFVAVDKLCEMLRVVSVKDGLLCALCWLLEVS